MSFGYTGRICYVDLDSKDIRIAQPDSALYHDFIGGEGLGVRLLHEHQPTGADALGPENTLGFLSGLLTGCGVPGSSRVMVVTKSPLTGTWGDSNAGGYFGPELKAAGFDAVFIRGVSEKPVYLWLTESRAEIRDAAHLWGEDTVDTVSALKSELGDSGIRTACIGPAGEKCSLISSIMLDDRAAARSGVGAVMGSKRLKAVVTRGKQSVKVFNPEAISRMRREFIKKLTGSDYFVIKTLREFGTCGLVTLGTKYGIAPVKNWKMSGEGAFPTCGRLDGSRVTQYQIKRSGCSDCPIVCGGIVGLTDGPFRGLTARKPEYETLVSFGNMCLNDDLESIIYAENICDRYGIDTISTGTAIAFAIECYENGLINQKDTGGIELSWGNSEAILALLQMIVSRQGIGEILADGVKKAAERIGGGSDRFAVHIHGQELPYHDFRYELPGRGTTYISDPTPARHERFSGAQILEIGEAIGPYAEFQLEKSEDWDYSGKGRAYARGAKYYEVFVSCGMCAFTIGASDSLPIVDMINAATGWEYNASRLLDTGERIQFLRHGFNLREGIGPLDFVLPQRLKSRPLFEGPMKGSNIDYDYNMLRKAYFQAMNWDVSTGFPSHKRIRELGLEGLMIDDPANFPRCDHS